MSPASSSSRVQLDVPGYPVAPAGLELQQVHIFIRHGERTPVGIRMADPPASIPEHWKMCKTARRFQAAVATYTGTSSALETGSAKATDSLLPSRKIVERVDGTSEEGECLLGELTDIGRQSTYDFGRNLREIYIKKLGFLPDTLHDVGDVYFRSTNMPRTIESLQQVMHGLYPASKLETDAPPSMYIRNGKDENLLGNTFSCKRLEILQVGFAQAAATAYNSTLEHLDKKVSKYIGGNPIRLDGKPRASGVLDTVKACISNGVKVPSEFEDKSVIDVIERAVVNEWFAGYKTEEVRRLGMGRLLNDLTKKMQIKVSSNWKPASEVDVPKLLVHSTHDTAIAALCSTLDVFDEKWPTFTASITFELFRQKEEEQTMTYLQSLLSPFSRPSGPNYYVRMRYQNRSLPLPFCSEAGKHLEGSPELCTLAAFKERVEELTPSDWEKECNPAGLRG